MTATLEKVCEVGSTTPRLHTPPLPGHTYGNGLCTREWSWGYDCVEFLEKVAGWTLLPWQRWLYIQALEKGPGKEGFRFKFLVVLIARQQGKTLWLKGLGLWRLYADPHGRSLPSCPGAQLAVVACQNLEYAETMLREVVDEIREHPKLKSELVNHRVVNGQNRVDLTNKRFWRAAAASRRGARSLSADIIMLDEIREHQTWDAYNALVATTTVRPYSQVVCTSNAGDAKSEVLRTMRDAAVRRIQANDTDVPEMIGFYEWSVPTDVDPRDESYWYLANPAMGVLNTFSLKTLRSYLETQQHRNMPGFQTEHLCQWVTAMEAGVVPAEHWAATLDNDSARAADAPVFAGVDVNYDRSRSYVGIAAPRADGSLHIEVVHAQAGTDWIVDWLLQRQDQFAGIAVQKTSAPASSLIPDLMAAGLPIVPLPVGLELQTACGLLYDGICQHKIFHRPAAGLDRAAASGIGRVAGDSWVFDRRNSPVDVAPLIACTAALWLAGLPEMPEPQVHAWPSDDVLDQWAAQGDRLEAAWMTT